MHKLTTYMYNPFLIVIYTNTLRFIPSSLVPIPHFTRSDPLHLGSSASFELFGYRGDHFGGLHFSASVSRKVVVGAQLVRGAVGQHRRRW